MQKTFHLNGKAVKPGERKTLEIHLSRLADHTDMGLTTHVIHGKNEGPVMFVSAAVHGDEIIGVEIIRRIAAVAAMKRLRGTLILVPIVNAYGFIALSRVTCLTGATSTVPSLAPRKAHWRPNSPTNS